jgi:hypothetical protein
MRTKHCMVPIFRKLRNEASVGVLSTPEQQKTAPSPPFYVNGQGQTRAQLDLGLITPN